MTYFPNLSNVKVLALDTETTGVNWVKDELFGFSISFDDQDYYWDVRKTPKAFDWLADQIKDFDGRIVNHNIKFDAHILRQHGIRIDHKKIRCTMIQAQIIDEHRYEYSLDSVAKDCIRFGKVDILEDLANMFGGDANKKQMENLHKAPVEFVGEYAKRDTRAALELYKWQTHEMEKQGLYDIFTLETDVLPVLIRMESRGIRVDIEAVHRNMAKLEKMIRESQKELNRITGRNFNPNSTPQVKDFFLEKDEDGNPVQVPGTNQWRMITGDVCGSTPKGNPSIGKDLLASINHPVAAAINKLRTEIKVHSILRDQILGYEVDGIIYPNFHQIGTVYGRFSATNPALQAIPKRNKEMSALTRSVFLPDDGEEMLRCDFEQSDFRGFVHYTESKPLVDAYNNDPWTDFHSMVAGIVGIPRNPGMGGANAKQINLGAIFGMGSGKLAKEMNLPYEEVINDRNGKVWLKPGTEAEEIFKKYHIAIPGVADFSKAASSKARRNGYVTSICGRKLRFPKKLKDFTYKAPGYLFASFTTDLCKRAMVEVDRLGEKLKLQIHDELLFSIEDRGSIKPIKEAMENALGDRTKVPIRTNPEVGPNWFECKPLEEH